MDDKDDYQKLPTDEKCVHKLWKARVAGYEEAAKLFSRIDDEKSPEWNKYLGLVKKFVSDSNAVAQEKGMEATLVFVENCFHAGKTSGEVMSAVVAKCIAAPKTKTKDLALQLTLMYVEIEKQEVVVEELLKGMDHKNPKIVSACTSALNQALKQFGNKVIQIKPLVKKIPALLTDRDEGVRTEGKALVVEMHRWIGPAIEPHIASLQAVVQQELRDMFSSNDKPTPTRYLRSQQTKMAAETAPTDAAQDAEEEEEDNDAAVDLFEPVEILSKLPKDFYEKLEAKKWQERKEALDSLETLLKAAPRLEAGDYADLVRALKKIISKDSNVMLVALGGRLLGMVAAGLRGRFQPYAVACISAILEKFKEKKSNVVAALRDAIDAIYPSTNLEAILEDVTEALNNKNPSVRSETALFLARAWCRTQPAALTKKLLKAYIGGLMKLLEGADPTARDAAAEAIATAAKLVGERSVAPHTDKLDPLKEAKIKEYQEKVVIQVKVAGAKKEKPVAAAAKTESKAGSAQPKPVKRPPTGAKKPAAPKKTEAKSNRETELGQEEVDEQAEAIFGPEVVSGLQDSDWKSRLAAVRSFQQTVCGLDPASTSAQVLLRTLNKRPGLKDTNTQVLRARMAALKHIADNMNVTATCVDFVLPDIVARLGEATVMLTAQDSLSTFSEACGLEHVTREALAFALDAQRNPKVQVELLNWLANAVQEFGLEMDEKPLIAQIKKAIAATNPNVRTAAINLMGVLSMYVGPGIMSALDGEKPALRQLIQAEVDKYANNTRPSPVREVKKSASKASVLSEPAECSPEVEERETPAATAIKDSERSDLALLVTEPLLAEINDKNWKVRAEALEKLSNMISAAAPIKSSLGELPAALTARLLDSNLKLVLAAHHICESLAVAMGTKCKVHVRTFFPAFFQALGDSKAWIRSAGASCLDTWCAQAGGAHVAFEGEMVADALRAGSAALRAELLQWLADKLPDASSKSLAREELTLCLPVLYACVEDRSAEVRRKAADCVLPFMLHLGYEAMHKQLDKLKPGSKSVVLAALDKARPSLPVQPLPKARKDDPKTVKSGGAMKNAEKKGVPAPKGKVARPASAPGRGKKEEEDLAPLLPSNNNKNQRIVDDQKLKVLKWNFVTPREEFFELLKDQMLGTGFQKQLVQNMFHNDFRYHLKALDCLFEDLKENGHSLQLNLDLVLKWLTLRFFDTNPSVILRGLEYLAAVFAYLIDNEYTMPEYEANCFIPYLILKLGDPKDSVRHGVKALLQQICVAYSATKLFGYLMEGLKSKNARQRTECLEVMGSLVGRYGCGVMSPSMGVALKELARHIGDRDNAVRSAALNCIADAHFLEGERVYKMIGQISDKDMSLLEERIKRANKGRENRKSVIMPLSATGKPIVRREEAIEPEEEEPASNQINVDVMTPNGNDEDDEDEPIDSVVVTPQQPAVVSGPFGLDPEVLARLEAQKPRTERAALPPRPDTSFLDEPVPSFRPVYSAQIDSKLSPLRPAHAGGMFGSPAPAPPTIDDSLLIDVIQAMASPDHAKALQSLRTINNALSTGRGAALRSYEERIVRSISQQLRQMRAAGDTNERVGELYKLTATTLASLYDTNGIGQEASSSSIGALLSELLLVLSGSDMPGGLGCTMDKEDVDKTVRVLNVACVKILERTRRTEILCALITLLHDSIGKQSSKHPRYQELLLKCLWKALKMFPGWHADSIDCDAVLYHIHNFFKAYPNSYWKSNPEQGDTAFRTIKTCVHSLVKMKGHSIMNHLARVPDAKNTDLYVYLQRTLQQVEETGQSEGAGRGEAGRVPRDVHEQLIEVLDTISSKRHDKQEAFTRLLQLKERCGPGNLWSYMQGSSLQLRSYVERGLADAERRSRGARPHAPVISNDENENEDEDDENMHLVYMERLRKLQAKAGIPLSQPGLTHASEPNRNDVAPLLSAKSHNMEPQLELRPAQPTTYHSEGHVDVEKLKLKLQQIKNASKR